MFTLPKKHLAAIVFLLLIAVSAVVLPVFAGDYSELQDEKSAKEDELAQVEDETGSLNQQISGYSNQIGQINNQLSSNSYLLAQKRDEIAKLEEEKDSREDQYAQKEEVRAKLIRDLYKRGQADPLTILFSSDGFSEFTQKLMIFEVTIKEIKKQAEELSKEIIELKGRIETEEQAKARLEQEITRLNREQEVLAIRKQRTAERINELQMYKNELLNEISSLSSRMQELIREKLSATAEFTSVGDREPAIQSLPEPPFSPAYAVFSRGYPHRVGMNQYGAYGRSKAGQSYKDILKAYYKDVDIVDYNCPDTITIYSGSGTEEIDFEGNYLKGIAEMPSYWGSDGGMEALKAQAIAARTYALAATGNGSSPICTTQRCQVYLASKVDNDAAANWHKAVEETEGKVITHGGSPIKAWYSSTAGGFTRLPTDFDVKWNSSPSYTKRMKDYDGDGNAYDGSEWGDSPWFYKAWFDSSYDEHPWLTEEEMQDLLNATLLPESYDEHLSQEDPVPGVSTDEGWSKDDVKEALEDEGIDPVGEITEIKLADSEDGYTENIFVASENYPDGEVLDGKRFRKIFVMRSRGYLALWSSLYDIVQRN